MKLLVTVLLLAGCKTGRADDSGATRCRDLGADGAAVPVIDFRSEPTYCLWLFRADGGAP